MNVGGFPFDLNEPAAVDGDADHMEDVIHHFDLNQPPEEGTEGHAQQQETMYHHHKRRPKLSYDQRLQILIFLLSNQSTKTPGKPYQGAIEDVAKMYHVTTRTISNIWNKAKKQKAAMQTYNMATNGHNSGRKRIKLLPNAVTDINMGDRTCIRDLASKLKVSSTTCSRMIKRGLIKPHTKPLHPGLNTANKLQRMAWVLDLLMGDTAATKRIYKPMFDFVHIDEK